jgi:hypothetical protein
MAANLLTSANVGVQPNNGSLTTSSITPHTIVAGDVTNGLSLPAAAVTGALSYSQAGFIPEQLTFVFNTTVAGTSFSVVTKATIATTDVPNSAPPFPSANAGDATFNINTVGVYNIGPFTSGRFEQPDGSFLLNFTGTLGTTTVYAIVEAYYPAGPRG